MEPRMRTIIVKSGFLCEENKITSLCLNGETASSIDSNSGGCFLLLGSDHWNLGFWREVSIQIPFI